ncbi:Protein of unknown function DUF2419 domain-containing protein [Rozella allomycis CSF55]|uniref:Queuosine 5'-phosphate N-glycosylase/hydrolase n=1 Tax=Rozella allomycis (strain CSF55) TaxID=988480 RepID=A0A075B226_ROZAC|nr:Protein of unknown function DUF2419 domain-containing protein [Rozella allomycis CSF55]|eukprot:EPZ34873.1 Protein of unknown function DUF2419 domain-containing protein [Rozella allomycis CSF55]
MNLAVTLEMDVYAFIELVLRYFPSFRDEVYPESIPILPFLKVKFYKRVQILIADVWSCFGGKNIGEFTNIDDITMFADYRVPQALCGLGILEYSPALLSKLNSSLNEEGENLELFSQEEIDIRASSILAVESIKKYLKGWNSILIDYYLWDFAKRTNLSHIPIHRIRTIYY